MSDRLRGTRIQPEQTVRKHRPDYVLLIIALALLAIGVIVVYSISPALGKAHGVSGNTYVARQGIAIGLGLLAFFVASRISIKTWQKFCMPLLGVAAVATLIAVVMPVDANYPAHRWIRLGGFSFQSVELLKFALLIWLAGLLGARIRSGDIARTGKTLKPLLAGLAIVGFVVAHIQSDLGSMAVIIAMMGMMAYVAGLPMKNLLIVGLIVGVLGLAAVVSSEYRRERLATFMNPTADCQNSGYQACQALISVGSGGFAGLGLGRSVQAYGYLPEAANDSIFAIYAEKFGFVGVTGLLCLFLAFFWRLKRIAERAPDHISRLIVVGILAWLATQTIINVGAMLGLLPLKGITLPLVSYGGTSVVFILAALGVVFQISKYTTYAAPEDPSASGRGRGAVVSRRPTDQRRRRTGAVV